MALAYLDDILCHSANLEQHLISLTQVFSAYQKAGLKLQPAKCFFFKTSTKYLGHIVSEKGLSPDPEYVKVVQDWPMPTTRSQVRAFLGKAGYYRKYIRDYAAVARPLTDVLQTDTFPDLKDKDPFTPTEAMLKAFDTLKSALLAEPILAFPDFGPNAKPFILDTDWSQSNGAIGCCLMQEQHGKERVIAYAAKRLDSTQLNYAPTKGELFAAMFAMKHFDYFLAGKKFVLRTDHSSLQYIKTMQPPSLVEGRWLECVTKYDFDVLYRKGTAHGNADALSRAEHLPPAVCALPHPPPADLAPLVELVRSKTHPTPQQAETFSPEIRFLLKYWPRLEYNHPNLVLRTPDKPPRQVISQRTFLDIGQSAHVTLGHKGPRSLQHFMDTRYFVFQSKVLAHSITASCNACATKTKPSSTGHRTAFHRTQAAMPWQHLSMDFVGPLPVTNRGHKYLLTVKDTFTGYLEAIPTRNMLASTVADVLLTQLFSRYGMPESLHTDQASNFTSQLLTELCQLLGVKLSHTPPYNQRSNPVERAHRDLKATLTALCEGKPTTWEKQLPAALFAQRVAVSQVTGFSPFYLMFGRQPRVPLDLLHPVPSADLFLSDVVRDMSRPWLSALQSARASAARQLAREEALYGRPVYSFHQGDLVWLFTPKSTLGAKFDIWWTGPWKIVQRRNPVTYDLVSCDESPGHPASTCTAVVDRLRPYAVSLDPRVAPNVSMPDVFEATAERDVLSVPDPVPTVPPPARRSRSSSRSRSPSPADSCYRTPASSPIPPEDPPLPPVSKSVPLPTRISPEAPPLSHDLPPVEQPPSLSDHLSLSEQEPKSPSLLSDSPSIPVAHTPGTPLSPPKPPSPPTPPSTPGAWSTAPFRPPQDLVPSTPKLPRMAARLAPHIPSPPRSDSRPLSERARRYMLRNRK